MMLCRSIGAMLIVSAFGIANCACSASDEASTTSSISPTATTSVRVSPPSTVAAPPGALITQPAQPTSGPGGSALPNGDWRISSGGDGPDAWYVFEPIEPQPVSAPLAIVMHGYYEFAGYDKMYEFIRHTVRTGTIVIYPQWQTGIAEPCPGPFDIEPCIASSVNGIRGALRYLESNSARVQPEFDETSYFGFSFGGIITANLANRHAALELPEPRAIFLDDPHDSGLSGQGEPSLDDSMAGVPSSVLLQCHVGAQGVISEVGKADSSCNALFPLLGHIPAKNKSLVLTEPDTHGALPLSSGYGVCASPAGAADVYDWNFCWKTWDALRSAALDGTDRRFALGDTPEHRDNGTWSDGTSIASLKIQDAAPIRP